ncbi:hypothetical protein [uncultured Tateyamaria sp.]|uniref:hypothetical protein n=1 Tax=uncultured Tateyamaria sp. TaxID=455651 RepID=UPI002613B68B|nr:hypothetical protein [uncultured Tateyamaria sp.]
MARGLCQIGDSVKGNVMKHPYKSLEMNSIYAQEQMLFAKMQDADQIRKRKQRRRRMLMWVLRRL